MNPFAPPSRPESAARSVSAVAELFEVLWDRVGNASSAPVSPSQLKVMYVLERHDGANLRTVAEALAARASSASRLCDRLQAVGFIEREMSASSRREVELRLSSRGRGYLRDLRARREAELTAILGAMPPARLTALVEGLESFRAVAAAHLAAVGVTEQADVRSA